MKVESPLNLYQFFQKATPLKQCIDQYSAANTELEKTRETIDRKQALLKDLGKQLQEKYNKVQHLSQLIKRDQEETRLKFHTGEPPNRGKNKSLVTQVTGTQRR